LLLVREARAEGLAPPADQRLQTQASKPLPQRLEGTAGTALTVLATTKGSTPPQLSATGARHGRLWSIPAQSFISAVYFQ